MSLPMLPVSRAAMPAWPETKPEDDPLSAARGIVFSVLFSLPAWLAVALVIWRFVI